MERIEKYKDHVEKIIKLMDVISHPMEMLKYR